MVAKANVFIIIVHLHSSLNTTIWDENKFAIDLSNI